MMGDTQFANSRDIMELTKAYSRSLQNDRERNSALDDAMKEVDEWNNRYGPSSPMEDEEETADAEESIA